MNIALYILGAILIGGFTYWMVKYFASDTARIALEGNGPFMTLFACMWMTVLILIGCSFSLLQP